MWACPCPPKGGRGKSFGEVGRAQASSLKRPNPARAGSARRKAGTGAGKGAGAKSPALRGGLKEPLRKPADARPVSGGPGRVSTSAAPDPPMSQRDANAAALRSGVGLGVVRRRPLLPDILTVKGAEATLRAQFRCPVKGGAPGGASSTLRHKLLVRQRFVPWGSTAPAPLPKPPPVFRSSPEDEEEEDTGQPLVLWEPNDGDEGEAVSVDGMLTKWLRPHQREGVQFLFECVTGMRDYEGQGCILADDMGLGKTLQGITLLWTLFKQGSPALGGTPVARRSLIVCPTSLVNNWACEIEKWLKGRLRCLPLSEASRDEVIQSIKTFLGPRNTFGVLILSYETFRIHSDRFKKEGSCDLLICDEAHRLKNDATATNRALDLLPCRRRVLLSGTPMQNNLDEFFAMVDFCNPGILGTNSVFKRKFEGPILRGREPDADDHTVQIGRERSLELSHRVNNFILRRTNDLLSKHLPPKVIQVVCCGLTDLQRQLYFHFLESKTTQALTDGKNKQQVLGAITALKKLCNHPKLIYDVVHSSAGVDPKAAEGFQDCDKFFLPGIFDNGRAGRGSMAEGWEFLSGKMAALANLLENLRQNTNDRIVLISNYTQTLDLFAQLCRQRGYPYVRLDGSTGMGKRMKLVTKFNDPLQNQFAFLLSSKAGGCGLNLIGGNRLVLFDPDWNPANDKQAAGRVWRDGQKKDVFVYRFLTTGTIEEKVFQRQMSKEGLQTLVDGQGQGQATKSTMTLDELRDLFTYRTDTTSDTHDTCGCVRCGVQSKDAAKNKAWEQVGHPTEQDLKNWAHHHGPETLPDEQMAKAWGSNVSFIFSCRVDEKSLLAKQAEAEQAAVKEAKDAQEADVTREPLAPIENRPGVAGKRKAETKFGRQDTKAEEEGEDAEVSRGETSDEGPSASDREMSGDESDEDPSRSQDTCNGEVSESESGSDEKEISEIMQRRPCSVSGRSDPLCGSGVAIRRERRKTLSQAEKSPYTPKRPRKASVVWRGTVVQTQSSSDDDFM